MSNWILFITIGNAHLVEVLSSTIVFLIGFSVRIESGLDTKPRYACLIWKICQQSCSIARFRSHRGLCVWLQIPYLFTHRTKVREREKGEEKKRRLALEKVDCFHSIASISNWLPSSSFDSLIMFHAPSAHSAICERDFFLSSFLLFLFIFGFAACLNVPLHLTVAKQQQQSVSKRCVAQL